MLEQRRAERPKEDSNRLLKMAGSSGREEGLLITVDGVRLGSTGKGGGDGIGQMLLMAVVESKGEKKRRGMPSTCSFG
jgi:hypothetical protein